VSRLRAWLAGGWRRWLCVACSWFLGTLIPERVPADCDWLLIRDD